MLALSDYMGNRNLLNIRFDTLQNSLNVNKGKVTIPAMSIESTLGHMELSGTHDNDQNIDRLSLLVSDHHLHTPIEHGVLIRGHGLYAVGRNIDEVRRHLEALEFLFSCELERLKIIGIQAGVTK